MRLIWFVYAHFAFLGFALVMFVWGALTAFSGDPTSAVGYACAGLAVLPVALAVQYVAKGAAVRLMGPPGSAPAGAASRERS